MARGCGGARIGATIDVAHRGSRTLVKWEYLVVPLKEAGGLRQGSSGLAPDHLNELGAEGWEAVGVTLKRGDLVAWPVVLLKRPVR